MEEEVKEEILDEFEENEIEAEEMLEKEAPRETFDEAEQQEDSEIQEDS